MPEQNVIAACINTDGGAAGDDSPCTQLLSLTTPPGGTAPTNTVDALVNLHRNPLLNVDDIYAIQTPSSPYEPSAVTVNVGAQNSGFVTIWAGRNNSGDQTTILSDIAAMVAALPSPKHYVVLSLTNRDSDSEFKGGAGYNQIIGVNQALASTYPNNYLDIRTAVVASYEPSNAEDVLDNSHDVPPSTLRALDEFGTLATAMDATTCTFSVTGGIEGDYTMFLDQEKVRVVQSDGINVTQCIRGYAGTQAAAHAQGISFSGIDYIHLNAAADIIIAKLVDQYIQSH